MQIFKNPPSKLFQEIKDTSYQNEDWFHGVLPREEVVRLLVSEGDFLVRETIRNDTKQLVLSVCSQGYKHFIVHMTSDVSGFLNICINLFFFLSLFY